MEKCLFKILILRTENLPKYWILIQYWTPVQQPSHNDNYYDDDDDVYWQPPVVLEIRVLDQEEGT